MLNGYVTYDELKLITGFKDAFLKTFLRDGIKKHVIKVSGFRGGQYTEVLYNLAEVEEWLKLWL